MIFSLEAMEAKHGDSLLLHYEEDSKKKIAVIDGGPQGVFSGSLRPRLEQLQTRRAHGGALSLRLLMVSHIDDDHIQGIIELARMVLDLEDAGTAPPFDFPSLWHNSFSDLVKKVQIAELDDVTDAAVAASAGEALPSWLKSLPTASRAVAASVPQGRTLRQLAEKLDCNLNPGFDGLVLATGKSDSIKKIGKGLTFTVLGPRRAQLDALQNDWADKVAALKKKKKGKVAQADLLAEAADYVDKSIYNLSSIVVLARDADKKTMLLTGDARGDNIIAGLTEAGLLKDGKIHVDLLKVPHHGSQHNVRQEFFETVTADHYVISANGRDGNPDPPMIQMLLSARGKSAYAVHLTNPVPHAVSALKAAAKKNSGLHLDVRKEPARSVVVNLVDPLTD